MSRSGRARFSRLPRSLWVVLTAPLCLLTEDWVADGHADIQRSVDSSGVIQFSNASSRAKAKAAAPSTTLPSRVGPALSREGAEVKSTRFDAIIREAAQLYQIPEALIRAVILVESGFDPRAVSPANAHGLMQLIPATAERMMVTDIHDPRQNIFGGTRYLRVLANMFNGNLALTLAGYNAGEGAVIKYGGVPPYLETQHYVRKVSMYYEQFRAD